jgi:hypothetical protein
MSLRRRYEILLPLQFNDGREVPASLLWETVEQRETRFRAVSWKSQVVRGLWQHEGMVFRDNNTRLVMDVADTVENREFLVALKEILKERFHQVDIWITSHAIDVV